jgi:Tol biopolymer transport system component
MMRILRAVAAVTLGALLAAPARPAAQAKADVALRAAMETETVKGDLKAAIEQYKKVATSSDRAIAARALLRLAECYQKLGDSESQRVYERLVRDFADQPDAVAAARARMGGGRTTSTGMVARQLWTTTSFANGPSQVTISGDGRRAAVAEGSFSDVQIRDLTTGQIGRLKVATAAAPGGYGEWPVLSPDARQIAFAYAGPDIGWNYQVRVAAAQPDAPARALGDPFSYMYVSGWSADGKSVLATNFSGRNVTQLAWVSTTDGSVKVLKSLTWQTGRPVISPDGKFIAYDVHREPGKPDAEILILASDGSAESIVAAAPGVNASPVWSPDGSRLVFKSNRSGSFGIWSIAVRDGRGEGSPTLLKADAGDIDLLGFTATGSLLHCHRSGSADIFAMDLDSAAGKVHGEAIRVVDTFLGSNVNPATSPDGKSLAYHRRTDLTNQWSTLVIRSLDSRTERVIPTVFRYAGTPAWLPDGQSIIQVARDVENHRTLYRVELRSGEVTRLMNDENFAPLPATSPDGRRVYAADTIPERAALRVIDIASGARTEIQHSGSVRGVAASPDGRSIAFVANESNIPARAHLYVADSDGANVRAILTTDKPDEFPLLAGGQRWSADSRFIYFLQQGKRSLWRIPAAGGAPALVGDLGKIPATSIDVSRDGRRVIFGAGSGFTVEVWALENVLPSPAVRK